MDLQLILSFVLLLNPFALFIYLKDVMENLSHKDFLRVMTRATVVSFLICILFAAFGDRIFMDIFHVDFQAFRVFGGVVLFSFAFLFIVRGHKTMIQVKSSLDEIANELAMPFMVGAGVISVSILMGHQGNYMLSAVQIAISLIINMAIVIALKFTKDYLTSINAKSFFDKFMGILVRLLSFMIGAIGVNMIFTGIKVLRECN